MTENIDSNTDDSVPAARHATATDNAAAPANDTESELDKRLRQAARNANRLERKAYLKEQREKKEKEKEKEQRALLLKQQQELKGQKERELMAFTPKTPLCPPTRATEYSPGSGCRLPYPTKTYQGTPMKKNKKGTMVKVDAFCPVDSLAESLEQSPYGNGGWGLGYDSEYDSDVDHADHEGTTSFLARLRAAKDTKVLKEVKLENDAVDIPASAKSSTPPPKEEHMAEPYAVQPLSRPVRREVTVTKTETTVGAIGDCPLQPANTNYISQTGMKRKGQFIHIYRCTVIPPAV